MTTLDLGALVGRVTLDDLQWRTTYVRVVREMANLGAQAERSSAGTTTLDGSLTGVAGASTAAATGLGGVNTALTETGASASRAAVAIGRSVDVTTEAGLATSKLTQATLRQSVAQQRLGELQATGTATTRQLAAAQASLIAANDRVALTQERVAESQMFGARSADRMRTAWGKIPGPVKAGAAALAFGAFEALKASSNYQKLTVNLVTGAGESQRNLKMVSDGMLHMAGQVGDSAQDLAKAMFLVESAGFHGASALTLLKTAAQGAKVDNADLTTVVDALTSAMNAYHEPAANAAKVTNTLIASAAVGKMHLQDLASSLGTVLPSAAALRVPLDQVGAALATMTMQGTDAQRAATYLRFAFAALANPTAKAQASMKAVGLTSQQVADTMTHGGLPAVFTLLQTAVGQKFPAGSARYLAALANMVGGTRGLQAVLELTGKNLTSMDANLQTIQGRVKGAGNTVSDWADVQKNLNVQWSQFIDGLGAAGIKIGTDLIPVATGLLHILNDTGHVISEVTKFLADNEAAAAALATVLTVALAPAALRVATAFAWGALEAASGLVLKLMDGIPALVGGLRALGASAIVSRGAVGLLVYSVIDGIIHLGHLNDVVNEARASLNAFAFDTGTSARQVSTYFTNAYQQIGAQQDAFNKKLTSWAPGAILSRALHPLSTIEDAFNFDHVNNALDQASYAAIRASSAVERVTETLGQIPTTENMDEVAKSMAAAGITAGDLSDSTGVLVGKVREYLATNKASQKPTALAAQALRDLGSGAQTAAQDVQSLTSALDLFAGNAISADQGAIAFRNDIVALDKALTKAHGSLSLNTQAGRDARDAFDAAAQQALNTAEAEAKLQGGAAKARHTLQDEIQTLKDHAGSSDYAKQAIQRLTTALDNLPSRQQGQRQGQSFGQGYADGVASMVPQVSANAAEMAQAAADAAKRKQQSHSPSRVAMKIGEDFGAGMALGINNSTGQVTESAKQLATSVVNAATSVFDSAKAKLTADISVRMQAASGISSSLLGGLDLSNAFVNGRTGNLAAFLKAGTVPLGLLSKDEAKLRKRGLDPALLAQIAGVAPNAGIALAQSILSGRSGSIQHLDALERRAQAYAKATGRLVAGAQYDPRIERDRQDVHDSAIALRSINSHFSELIRLFREKPHLTGREVAAAINGWATNAHHKAQSRTSR